MVFGRSLVIVLFLSLLVALSPAPSTAQELSPVLVYSGNLGLNGGHNYFAQATGRTLVELWDLPSDLSAYGCVVLPLNRETFSQDQIDQLVAYLKAGRRLFAVGEHSGFPSSNANLNALAAGLGSGLSIISDEIDLGSPVTTNIEPTFLTQGVSSLGYGGTSQISATGNAQVVARTRGESGVPFIGAELIGEGLFVLVGDSTLFGDSSATAYANQDNGQLAYNLCSEPLPAPVLVYTGNQGESHGFTDFGRAVGRTVEEKDNFPSDLSGYHCVILTMNEVLFSDDEVAQFAAYVRGGGRLFALGEHSNYRPVITDVMNQVAYGVGSSLSIVNAAIGSGIQVTTNITPSHYTQGVSSLAVGGTARVTAGDTGQVLAMTPGTNGSPFIGAESIGDGLFVLSGDTNVFSDFSDAFTGTDNGRLAFNLCSGNLPPSVTIDGVVEGTSYEVGSVPAATCAAYDPEDGPSSFPATLSDITGPLAHLGLGSQTAECSYTDDGGATTSASVTYSIVDTTAPALNMPGDTTEQATGPSGAVVTFSVTATDLVDPNPTITCKPESGDVFPLGETTVTCTATDAAENISASQSFTITVQDTTAPTLTMPEDMTEEATGPGGVSVTFLPTASDTVDPSPTIDCDHDSGDTFPLGETTVTCTATDASDNTSASESFTITVEDMTPPTLTMPENQTVEATSDLGASVTFTVTAEDLVDPNPTIDCSHESGETFSIGQTTVSCTATDASNNTSEPQSFTITVGDTTPPVIAPLPDLVVPASGPSGATVTWVATATDAIDGTLAVECSPVSGSFFAIPTPRGDSITTVNCSATDSSNNTSSASFTVTVLGAVSQFDQLQAEVQGASIHRNAKTSLDRALASAEQGVERNRLSQSCVQLSYFQTQVNLYRAMGQMTSEQANEWLADAARLKAVLGC